MGRILVWCVLVLVTVSGCMTGPNSGNSGGYQIKERDIANVQYRMLDSVNFLRQASGASTIGLDARLTLAAQLHADDIARQKRAWPFGSDGSTPYDRVLRSGFPGVLVSEVYSQSGETETETLTAWIEDQAWGPALLDPEATHMGFAWHREPSGIFWWVLVLGKATGPVQPAI